MNRAALRRFEFFDVDTISEDISATLVSLLLYVVIAFVITKFFLPRDVCLLVP